MSWFRRQLSKSSRLANLSRPTSRSSLSHSQQYTTTSHHADIIRDCKVEQLYSYTSGRWLWNENHQLARHYVEFDLSGLLQVSAQAIGARSCINVEKLTEGNFNKVFLITADNGRELIAKLPNLNAGRSYFTTASDVTTMDCVRNVLGIPDPRVYDWSSSTDNPVRAEYILMERSEGLELGNLWDDMPWESRLEIITTLAEYEKAFVSAKFPTFGSLYYAKDLPDPSPNQLLGSLNSANKGKAFAVGPTTNRAFFDQGRDSVEIFRGPWPSLEDYVQSRVARELACIDKFSSYLGQQGLFNGPNQYHPTKALKTEVLHDYLKVANQILPDDTNLLKPTLWYSDLHNDSIFVDPSQPTKILNIVDWQAVNISPLFLQARHPLLIEFEGPIPEGFEPIELPDGIDDMSEEAQHQAKNLRAAQSLYKLYEILMLQQRPEIAHALRFRGILRGQITGLSSSIFSDGEPVLKRMLIRLQNEWASCVGPSVPCPLFFSPEDRADQQSLEASWGKSVELMHEVLTDVGAYQGWDGWVNHSNYDVFKERLVQCQKNFLDRYANTEDERSQCIEAWPFKG